MNQNNLSSRAHSIIKSAIAAAVLPIIIIYIMIAKPDYALMNAMSHVVVPVARWTGGVITWPIRAAANVAGNVRELSYLRAENAELRDALDAARARMSGCDIAIAENQKLNRELDIVRATPSGAVVADVTHDPGAFNNATIFINRGTRDGVKPGMVVVSMDNSLVGIVADTGTGFAKVRTLADSDINIAVRIAGSEVYGFLTGNGSRRPVVGLFSDPEFQPTPGIKLVTSNISGVLPGGIFVGSLDADMDANVIDAGALSRVMVLMFDDGGVYNR